MKKSSQLIDEIRGKYNFDNSVGKALKLKREIDSEGSDDKKFYLGESEEWTKLNSCNNIDLAFGCLKKIVGGNIDMLARVVPPEKEDDLNYILGMCEDYSCVVNKKLLLEELKEDFLDICEENSISIE